MTALEEHRRLAYHAILTPALETAKRRMQAKWIKREGDRVMAAAVILLLAEVERTRGWVTDDDRINTLLALVETLRGQIKHSTAFIEALIEIAPDGEVEKIRDRFRAERRGTESA